MTDAPLDWFDTYLRDEPGLLSDAAGGAARAGRRRTGASSTTGRRRRHPPRGTSTPMVGWRPTRPTTRPSPTATATTRPTRRRRSAASACSPAARVDNRGLEARDDVLVYTSDALGEALELVGPVSATVHLESTLDHVDVFVRVCDVHPDGASYNVCDALQRFTPDDDRRATPTACSPRRSRSGPSVTGSPPATGSASRSRADRTPSTHGTSAPVSPPPRPSTWWPTTSPSTTQPTGRHWWCCPTSPEVTTRCCGQAAGQAGILLLRRSSPTATNADET